HDPIAPMFITFQRKIEGGLMLIRTKAVNTKQTLATLEKASKKFNPKYPFYYIFPDDIFKFQYHSEMIIGQLANVFAFLAIFISCLGLFGMAMFMAEQRTKEIGLRKELGATVFTLLPLLSKDFVALVIIALAIAAPMAWYFMSKWLQSYQYRTSISWWIFAAAAAGML